jgi:hypothetical protein
LSALLTRSEKVLLVSFVQGRVAATSRCGVDDHLLATYRHATSQEAQPITLVGSFVTWTSDRSVCLVFETRRGLQPLTVLRELPKAALTPIILYAITAISAGA